MSAERADDENYKCEGCGKHIKASDVEPYGDGRCHTIPNQIDYNEWEPVPCGPVVKLN